MTDALILRALGLGDFLTGVPAFRAIRRALPEHRITLAAPRVLEPLLPLLTRDDVPVIDDLQHVEDLDTPLRSSGQLDIAIDLHGNGPKSKQPLQALEPAHLLCFAGPGQDGRWVQGPTWHPDEHEVHRWCRLINEGWRAPADPRDILLSRPITSQRPPINAVVVHSGAASKARCWPMDRFAAVAREMQNRGHCVVLTGTAEELPTVKVISELAALPATSQLAGRTDLLQLASLVSQARLVISGDTGVMHLAGAFRTPSVALMGPTPPSRWGPPPNGPHEVLWRGSGVGDPHGSTTDPALLRVSVDEVLAAADRATAATSSSN